MSLNDGAIDNEGQVDPNIAAMVLTTTPVAKMFEPKELPAGSNKLLEMVATSQNVQVKFKDVTEKSVKTQDMQEMMEELSVAGSISRADADRVDNAFESFYKSVQPTEFTRSPTRTNYQFAMNFMKKSMSVSLESLRTEFDTFFKAPLMDAKQVVARVSTEYLPTLHQHLQEMAALCATEGSTIATNKNLIIPNDKGFTDLRSLHLQELTDNMSESQLMQRNNVYQSWQSIYRLWKDCSLFRSLMLGVLHSNPVDNIFDSGWMATTYAKAITTVDLTKVFASPYLFEVLQTLLDRTNTAIEKLESIEDEAQSCAMDPVKCRDFIVQHQTVISDMLCFSHMLTEAVAVMLQAIPAVKTLVETFSSEK